MVRADMTDNGRAHGISYVWQEEREDYWALLDAVDAPAISNETNKRG